MFTCVWKQTQWLLMLFTVCFAAQPNIGTFWHVTDFHYDPTYWTSQLSCNAEVTHPSLFGDYWCDSPWKLVTTAIQAMATHSRDVDFLIWTGDTVAHIKDDDLSLDNNMDILKNLTTALRDAFPDKTVYASYGNHDYYPSNQFPHLNNLIYNLTALMWQLWIEEPAQMDNFRKGGYYTRLVSRGLRIVALNTNLYYTSNKQTPGISDPSDQFQWFRSVLQNARNASEKVIVTGHIPPGVHTPTRVVWFQQEFQQPMQSVLQDFTDVIVAMHFGHDHHDGFKVFYDKQGQAAVPLFVAPSVTPWRYKVQGMPGPAHNPSVRLVTYDRHTGRHLNIEQLRLDLPQSNAQGVANFSLLYSFTQHYKVPDVSARSLQQLVTRMDSRAEGDQLLKDYFWFATAGADQGKRTCDKSCQSRILCGFKHYDYQSFDACVDNYVSSASGLFPFAAALVFMVVTVLMLF
ncbi:hypothetical protein ACOMHN_063431 [Nucella lapillus]